MSSDNQSGSGSVMLAFMVGAITGAAVALLFAPASGDETREYLGQRAREGRDRAREAAEQSREFYERNRESVTTAIDRGREAFQQARDRGEQSRERGEQA
jgi:gas vesicle protein